MKQMPLLQKLSAAGNIMHALFRVAGCIFLAALFSTEAKAQGNLMMNPRRVVFEGNKKMQELNIANTGQDTARYVLSFMNIRMKENGSFEAIQFPDSGQLFADSYLRIFPRSVVLAPNESQVVKIQLTKQGQLADGEYRSHLYFRAVPQANPLGEEAPKRDSGEIAVKLIPVFGITIPVIVRVGELAADVTISNLLLETNKDEAPQLNLVFNRNGTMSAYGDLSVNYVAPNGKAKEVAMVRGIGIYTPNTRRQFQLNLDNATVIDYHTGKLQLIYKTQDAKNSKILAETELILNEEHSTTQKYKTSGTQ